MTDLNSAMFFFFKQKTAYEMRISDWSSDVCSSDLRDEHHQHAVADPARGAEIERPGEEHGKGRPKARTEQGAEDRNAPQQRDHAPQDQWHRDHVDEIGRAPCREKVCTLVYISGVHGHLKKKKSKKTTKK